MISRMLVWLLFLTLSGDLLIAQFPSSRAALPNKLLEQRAATLQRQGRLEEAIDIYLDLLYRDPRNSNMYFRVASLLPGQDNATVLLQILEDILAQQPGNTRLAAEKGRLLYLLDRKEEARDYWQSLVANKQTERFNYGTISNAMLQAGATDEAIEMLLQGRTTLKDNQAYAFDLARIYAAKHNYSMAGREYLAHLDGNKGMLDHISNQLIAMLENDGAYAALDAEFQSILHSKGDHQTILLARAKILLHEQRYSECVAVVLASDVSKETRHVFSIANDLAAEHAWEEAAELYLYISSHSNNKKELGEALLKLASTYENRLQPEETYHSLSGYFQGNQFLQPDVRLIGQKGSSLERTLKLYDSLQTLLPKTPEAFQATYNIAEIHMTVSGDIDRALRGYEYIFDQSPNRAEKIKAGLRMVDAWLVRGDTTQAIKALENVAKRTHLDEDQPQYVTSRIKILLNEAALADLQKELLNLSGAAAPSDPVYNDGMELTALIEGNGGMEDPLLQAYFKAEQKIYQHKLMEAIKLLQSIDGTAKTIADEAQVRAIQLLLLLGKTDEAAEAMDHFLTTFADSEWRPNVLVWQGEHFQFVRKDPLAAIPFYEEVIVNYPGYLEVQKVRIRLRQLLGSGT